MTCIVLHYYSGWPQPQIHLFSKDGTQTIQKLSPSHHLKGRSSQEQVFSIELEAGTLFFLSNNREEDRPDWGKVYEAPSFSCALVEGEFYSWPYMSSKSFRVDWSEQSRHFLLPFFLRFYASRLQEKATPLLILNDGQNQWKGHGYWGGWHSDEITKQLLRQGKIESLYLLAIDHPPTRRETYLPTYQAKEYVDFLAEELIPKLRKKYNISTISIAGSSYGGVSALYAGVMRPDVFTQVACLSYAWYPQEKMLNLLQKKALPLKKLYLDAGTRWTENPEDQRHDYQELTQQLFETIREQNPSLPIDYHIAEGHAHNEKFWSQRFSQVLISLFSPEIKDKE